MTEQDPRDEPGTTPAPRRAAVTAAGASAATPRHRKADAAALTSWPAVLQRLDRRGLLIVGGVLVTLLLLAVGYVALIAKDLGNEHAPTTAGSAPQAGPAPIGAGPSSAGPSGTAAADATPSGGAPSAGPGEPGPTPANPGASPTSGANDDGRTESGSTAPARRPGPRLVGPSTFDGFSQLLSAFCKNRGQRTAVLLEGPDYNPKTGSWVCTKVTTFTAINLDEACRDSFGAESQARQTTRRDSRTWRCFDR